MPVWDEEWEPRGEGVYSQTCGSTVAYGPMNDDDQKLIAAAPAMARLLLSLEWAGAYTTDTGGGDGEPMQPTCLTCEKERSHGHAPDCRWLAVMQAAGVRE